MFFQIAFSTKFAQRQYRLVAKHGDYITVDISTASEPMFYTTKNWRVYVP